MVNTFIKPIYYYEKIAGYYRGLATFLIYVFISDKNITVFKSARKQDPCFCQKNGAIYKALLSAIVGLWYYKQL